MTVLDGTLLWIRMPAGWVEVAAFDDDGAAGRHWDERLAPLRAVDPELTVLLWDRLAQLRRQVAGQPVLAAGAVFTTVPVEGSEVGGPGDVSTGASPGTGRRDTATVWQYNFSLTPDAPSAELDVLALTGRAVHRSVLSVDEEEAFTSAGGDGRAWYTTIAPEESGVPMGGCMAALALPVLGSRVLVGSGVAPTVDQRGAMAVVLAAMLRSVQVRTEQDGPPEGVVPLGATGGSP